MNVALDILSRIHTIPTVPIVDCFQKIRQQVKCYLQLAGVMGKNECMQVRFVIFVSHFFCLCHLFISVKALGHRVHGNSGSTISFILQYFSAETESNLNICKELNSISMLRFTS